MFKSVLVLIAAAAIGAWVISSQATYAADEAPAAGAPGGPMPISVATVSQQELTVWKDFSGRLRAVEDVQIQPRVSGAIEEVNFKEGDIVEKGTRLFIIDQRPFKATLAQADAAVAGAKATVTLASSDLKRAKSLLEEKAVSQREYDEKNNSYQVALASVRVAEATRDLAKLDVEYSEVKAPITGRVGRADLSVGNMVTAGQSLLTTMQSISPVYADFDIDEQTYLGLVKSVRSENRAADMPVFMALADEVDAKREGLIVAFDNQLAVASGTIRVRAQFDNPDGILTPGLFARIRLGSADKQTATIVNDSAVGTNQSKRFVYVVKQDGTVEYRPVTLGSVQGMMRTIDSGLVAGENVIVNGLMRVQPGMKVQPMMVSMETLQPLDAPAAAMDAPPAEVKPEEVKPEEAPPVEAVAPAPAPEIAPEASAEEVTPPADMAPKAP